MSQVPLYLDLLAAPLDKHKDFLIRFGNLESKLLTYDIEDIKIEKPVFISGLARSGSTILVEILASHPDVSSHQYRDYPYLHVHYFWNIVRMFVPSTDKKVERAHKDRLMINAGSPEALEEMLWTSFFKDLHTPEQNAVLSENTQNKDFENFYKDNIRKNLYLRKRKRFACKNNYNLTRIKYLKKLFPDARFIIPVRLPEEHIASLVKQNKLFRDAQKDDERSKRYTKRLEHYEFGYDFRPLNTGNPEEIATIQSLWEKEEYTLAYAHYWNALHLYIADILKDPELQGSVKLVRYDDFCNTPAKTIEDITTFCALTPKSEDWIQNWAKDISAPTYYKPDFPEDIRAQIKEITAPAQNLLWKDK
ncbi:MAG: sulfotransferase [Alphaproteobacteria bacterium]|nr:sulfotransferase [Alphaproteobacteria bacterium]